MICNFRKRNISRKDKEIIKECATAGALAQIQQACNRSDAMMALAMHNVGLSPKTINKVLKEREKMYQKFGEYRQDGCADFGFQYHLKNIGINIDFDFDEI